VKRRKILLLLGLASVSGSLALACGNNQGANTSSSPSEPAATTAGSESGEELVVYSGRNKKLIGELIEKFEQETGTKVKARYGDTAELAAALQEEGKNSPADLFFAQDAGALGAIQKTGMVAQLPEALLNKVDARYRSPEGKWVGITGRVRTVDYNTKLVKPAELPNTIFAFTDPKWKGKIGWAPTNGSFQAFVTALRVSQGEEKAKQWLEGIKANAPKTYPNNVSIIEALSKGEVAVGFVNHYYLAGFKKENPQAPVEHHFLDDVGSLVNVAGVAILSSAKHPDKAQKFVDFMLGKEAQEYFANKTYEYPLADGVKPAGQLKSLEEIKSSKVDLSNLNDLPGTLKLLEETGVL
jgi:iron(III) transport system substrate-binding protein